MRSKLKWILCGLLAAAVLLTLVLSLYTERKQYAPVTWLSDAAYAAILRTQHEGMRPSRAGTLRILGEAAPFDVTQNIYYVPQSLESPAWDLPLDWSNRRYTAYLVPDAMLHDKPAAIAAGHAFTLLVSDGTEYFLEPLIFTGMPMIALSQRSDAINNESVFHMQAFDPTGGADGGYVVTASYASIHKRGMGSLVWPKNSYRMNLFDSHSAGNYVSLLQLREDDDWILNAMYLDPQKMRDKLCSDLWNELCQTNDANIPYSHAALTELMLAGDYYGLYCLMEPVGTKNTRLKRDRDFLFQFDNWFRVMFDEGATCSIEDLSSIGKFEHMAGNVQEALRQMEAVCDFVNMFLTCADPISAEVVAAQLNLSSLIDFSLFNEATANWDLIEKNAFLLGQWQADGSYRYTLLPWDCDLSFGCGASGEFNPAYLLRDDRRMELVRIEAAVPALVRPQIRARWFELRKNLLSNKAIFARFDALAARNAASGALARDRMRWPDALNDTDVTPTHTYMQERLAHLDAFYAALD